MTDQSTPNKDEKLRILARELMPFLAPHLEEFLPPFLDGLKNTPQTSQKPRQRQFKPHKNQLYLPEIDYLCWYTHYVGLLKICGYDRHGGITIGNARNYAEAPHGLQVTGGNGDMREDYIFPTGLLQAFVSGVYDMNYLWDYRLTTDSRTMYMKGVFDGAQEVKRNTCTRPIHMAGGPVITQQVIDDTRAYWCTMPDDGGRSIVTKATMEELLGNFEMGLMAPGRVPWHIDVTLRNNMRDLTMAERIAGIIPDAPDVNPVPTNEMPFDLLKEPRKISIART